jgi:hypothetical protein
MVKEKEKSDELDDRIQSQLNEAQRALTELQNLITAQRSARSGGPDSGSN